MQTERKEQVATLPDKRAYEGHNWSGKKELVERSVLVVADGEELHEVVDVRIWMARSGDGASPKYATVWVHCRDGSSLSASGRADGYGYCKSSAAVGDAIAKAGIKLTLAVSGVGMSAVGRALHAIANAAGYADCHVRRIV